MTGPKRPTPEAVLIDMRAVAANPDQEACHAEADRLLVATLRDFGFAAAMDVYDEIPKWFA